MSLKYIKPEHISLKKHPEFNERWVQNQIAEDPTILGLGDVYLKDKERKQPKAGRLDLLLQEIDTDSRYEVEIQLGETDESHIIRCIEYWDIERKRYPQYEHTAVLVAEKVNSRFLNVASLFNGFIPLIAIQMNAFQVDDQIGLIFTTVMDKISLGLIDDDEEVTATVDRSYWEKRVSVSALESVDKMLQFIQMFEPKAVLNFNQSYVGLIVDDRINNFATFTPRKSGIRVNIRIEKTEETDQELENAGVSILDYKKNCYRVIIPYDEPDKHQELLTSLFEKAYQ